MDANFLRHASRVFPTLGLARAGWTGHEELLQEYDVARVWSQGFGRTDVPGGGSGVPRRSGGSSQVGSHAALGGMSMGMRISQEMPVPEVLRRIRPDLRSWETYKPARSGLENGFVLLDANESPHSPWSEPYCLHRYPEPQSMALRRAWSHFLHVSVDSIFAGRGSDESIDLLCRLFCRPQQDAILIAPPTFDYYAVMARLQGARVVEVFAPGRILRASNEQILTATHKNPDIKLVFLCSPNNPTGEVVRGDFVRDLAKHLTKQALVVVDEAYVEFSGEESLAEDAGKIPNLAVLRTLSKAHGLAAARVGVCVGHPRIIELLHRIASPYGNSGLGIYASCRALSASGLAQTRWRIDGIRKERARVVAALSECACVSQVFPSQANFVLILAQDAESFVARLRACRIRVRDLRHAIARGFRITIGDKKENSLLLEALGAHDRSPRVRTRTAEIQRRTTETDIVCHVDLAGGNCEVSTGIGFLDHMLQQVARHGGFGLRLFCRGDLQVDVHHSVEDCAIALGCALRKALGSKVGVRRYGFVLPMDESRALVALDLSGRSFLRFEGAFPDEQVGEMPTTMIAHFFRSFAENLKATLHIEVKGSDSHHMAEACFKGLGCVLCDAMARSGRGLPSTKGQL